MKNKQIMFLLMTALLILTLSLPVLAEFVFIEAESGKTSNFPIIDNAGAFNGKAIEAQTADDEIVYTFNIEKAGKYTIWARVWGVDSTMNSFLYSLNGDMFNDALWIFDLYEAVGEISNDADPYYDPMINTSDLYETWYWMRINWRDNSGDPAIWHNTKIFDMKAGENTLLIKARELSSRIDKLIITDDLGYDPKTISGDPEAPYLAEFAAAKAAADAAAAAAAAEEAAPAPAAEQRPAPQAPRTADGSMVFVLILIPAAVLSVLLLRKKRKI